MRRCFAMLITIVFVCGYATIWSRGSEEKETKTLTIRWQRLVNEKGLTCERCGSTEKELQEAVRSLKKSLGALGIEVVFEKKALDPETCAKDISQSNRIWIGERPLEQWLGAKVGKSLCGFCYGKPGGTVECRTVIVYGQTYETIPAELIIKAGLLAGSELLKAPSGGSCCPAQGSMRKESSKRCPISPQCRDKGKQ